MFRIISFPFQDSFHLMALRDFIRMLFVPGFFKTEDRGNHVIKAGRFFLGRICYYQSIKICLFQPVCIDADGILSLQADRQCTESTGSGHITRSLQGFGKSEHEITDGGGESINGKFRQLLIDQRNRFLPFFFLRLLFLLCRQIVFLRRDILGHCADFTIELLYTVPDLTEFFFRQRRLTAGSQFQEFLPGFGCVTPALDNLCTFPGQGCIALAFTNDLLFFRRRDFLFLTGKKLCEVEFSGLEDHLASLGAEEKPSGIQRIVIKKRKQLGGFLLEQCVFFRTGDTVDRKDSMKTRPGRLFSLLQVVISAGVCDIRDAWHEISEIIR